MSYALIRPLLFRLAAEDAHDLSLKALKVAKKTGILPLVAAQAKGYPVTVMGLDFPNQIGLAAGLDKNGDYIDSLAGLGFGFLEIGTVTPRPQPGNAKPRMFRMVDEQAIINRMGFNNKGVDYLVQRLRQADYKGIIGVNVGKNKATPMAQSGDDYVACIEKVFALASYITINISSPNTPGLRSLQFGDSLRAMLAQIKDCQLRLQNMHKRKVPLVLKIAPDMADEELLLVAKALLDFDVNGVIATNTTLSRAGVEGNSTSHEAGGLSGKPLTGRATHVVRVLSGALENKIPVIASGGVMSASDALEKFRAGAQLVQLYSGLIYQGPGLIGASAATLSENQP